MNIFNEQMVDLINVLAENLFSTIMLNATLGILILLNILLGALIAYKGQEWNTKKFLLGFLKGFLIMLCGIAFCEVLDVLPVLSHLIGVELPANIMTFGEVTGILYIAIKKYIIEISDKFKEVIGFSEEELKEIPTYSTIKEKLEG